MNDVMGLMAHQLTASKVAKQRRLRGRLPMAQVTVRLPREVLAALADKAPGAAPRLARQILVDWADALDVRSAAPDLATL